MTDVVIDARVIRGIAGRIEQSQTQLSSIAVTVLGSADFGAAEVRSAFETALRVQADTIAVLENNTCAVAKQAHGVVSAFEDWDASRARAAGR
ncbi:MULTISPECIES: hypothetical protein [unclassified Curtobacterium]|uniref:hypothetical protein n=1 Tax=unclassified Curtobacterium TaxID=257496 RepID=UPI00052AFCE3|nr:MULTISPECIES: hypothetical protein [unclassified Curtobacterium]AIV39844.1 hypothetical protein NI26_05815 [Curtobacterium sp. MR_MD2014]MCM3504883.1 hypothetical protein [Curtobacterium sp. ODYSSEY 48 V2]